MLIRAVGKAIAPYYVIRGCSVGNAIGNGKQCRFGSCPAKIGGNYLSTPARIARHSGNGEVSFIRHSFIYKKGQQ